MKNKKGFTLIELLIVVAIIGVLATVGIPTYRKMVMKAKTSEAKVALGGLYTAQMAFSAEYGMYGNNLDKMGFEFGGSGGSSTAVSTGGTTLGVGSSGGGAKIYTIGFPAANCANTTNLEPRSGSAPDAGLVVAFPTYYPNTAGVPNGNVTASDATTDGGPFRTRYEAALNRPTACLTGSVVNGAAAAFTGTATGKISPSAPLNNLALLDQWRIDASRTLTNPVSGVN